MRTIIKDKYKNDLLYIIFNSKIEKCIKRRKWWFNIAEMLTDLLNAIYNRISQLGKSIQELKASLDDLNQNIEEKITNLNEKIAEFSNEIGVTQTKHIEVLKSIGEGVKEEIETVQNGLALDSFENLISNLEKFEKLAKEILNQDTVNLLLSEAIDSVKNLKKSLKEEEVEEESV
ncbi:MAG: hypothetical protein GF383_14220 [Candidatus Lokiarchaeota archaeon]|nr:hypothetical protein [Candidatus Lokiarchaeota archaeon]MBD3342512.1 hypothetical protein [Candidatus Lokiarchaeota archaeon]